MLSQLWVLPASREADLAFIPRHTDPMFEHSSSELLQVTTLFTLFKQVSACVSVFS